ncbi:MAG: ABC transporter substrate-binding protein [Fodinibius sp.]|nr:ABC transporter substrate-binding protein [Fodinibius sp.]MDZ7659568.1 ABC transporter substrate-binding protein [Fodinibius sp.]
MRIVSLLPSTTEIVEALGKKDKLVGRSHECNYPDDITTLPACTEPKFKPDGSSYEIDQRVKALLQEGLSVYRVNEEKLAELKPDIILTQDHCEVCAASLDDVKQAVRQTLGEHVKIVSVSPTDLSSWVQSIRTIADAIDANEAAEELTGRMKSELQEIQQKTIELTPPKVLSIEWMDPLMTAGNWIPELVHKLQVVFPWALRQAIILRKFPSIPFNDSIPILSPLFPVVTPSINPFQKFQRLPLEMVGINSVQYKTSRYILPMAITISTGRDLVL